MKSKLLPILLILLAVASPALAKPAKLDTALIDDAKQALTLMADGEYKQALKVLAFVKNEPSAAQLSEFAQASLSDLPNVAVQTEVTVAYRLKGVWRVAVPIEAPSFDSVQTLVLRSKNGKAFDAYKAMSWYEVESDLASADPVIWQEAYEPSEMFLAADD
ncbi:MAG: hypothetical protein VB067_00785 [Christensenellaceae bacterium]|nr:hypothetical protein [Christensenellaceae bacterium]MEA5067500.1 hypothetical protein [Christensenellaceae bacterium]